MRWPFYKSEYSFVELTQLDKVVSQFKTHRIEIPNHLRLKSDVLPGKNRQPINVPGLDSQRYVYRHWVGKIPPSCAHELIGVAVSSICTYQKRRSQRWNVFRRGYPDDPTNQLCEYLKEWLVNLSHRRIEPGLLDDIDRHIKLIQSLVSPQIFPPGKFATRTTMTDMLGRLQHTLVEARKKIHKVYTEKSLSDSYQDLSFMTEHMASHAETYLYCIYLVNNVGDDEGGFSPARFLTKPLFSLRDEARDKKFKALVAAHKNYKHLSRERKHSYCAELLEKRLRPLTLLDNDTTCRECENRDLDNLYSTLLDNIYCIVKYSNAFTAIMKMAKGQEIVFVQFGFEMLITLCDGYQRAITALQDSFQCLESWSSLHLSHAARTMRRNANSAWQDNRKQCIAALDAVEAQIPHAEVLIKSLRESLKMECNHRQTLFAGQIEKRDEVQGHLKQILAKF